MLRAGDDEHSEGLVTVKMHQSGTSTERCVFCIVVQNMLRCGEDIYLFEVHVGIPNMFWFDLNYLLI